MLGRYKPHIPVWLEKLQLPGRDSEEKESELI